MMLSPLVKARQALRHAALADRHIIVDALVGLLLASRGDSDGRAGRRMDRAGAGNRRQDQAGALGAEQNRSRRSLRSGARSLASDANAVAPSAPNVIMPVLAFVTPAVGELLLFFGTLVFILASQIEMRGNHLAMMFGTREAQVTRAEDHARHRAQFGPLSDGRHVRQRHARCHRRAGLLARSDCPTRRSSACWRRS